MNRIVSPAPRKTTCPDEIYSVAKEYFLAGHYREAILNLNKLRNNLNYCVRANSNIASCLLIMKLIRPAERFISRALRTDPSYIPALLNRAKALEAQHSYNDVQEVCQLILKQDPVEEEAWMHWAKSLTMTHQVEAALKVARRWQSQVPSSLDAHLLEGELLCQQGDYKKAITPFGEALRINPKAEKPYVNLSGVMIKLRRLDVALQYIDKAYAINHNSFSICCRKAQILWLMSYWDKASEWYGKAFLIRPESASLFLNQHLMLPSIPKSNQEIEEARKKFISGLEHAENTPTIRLDFLDEAVPHTFQLGYHNKADKALLERYINLMRSLAEPLLKRYQDAIRTESAASVKPKYDRIRIGFLSRNFTNHSNSIAFEGLIRFLDRARFDVILIHTAGSSRDVFRDSLDAACEETIQLTTNHADSFQTLRSLELDVLFFTDIGMSAYEFLLPFFRSAPIQITGWGVPHTSGINEIDFYISASDLEPAGSEDHYTETLVRLPGGLPCYFNTKGMNFSPLSRDYFILPPVDTLIGCLQGLHKIHPDFDIILEQIAQENSDALFVFVVDPIEERTAAFLERLSRTAPTVASNCIMLSVMTRGEYHALCNCIDLLLDPIYYGSGITFFEAAYVGTPIITMEGHNLRSRVVASGYREMGIEDLPIATAKEDYAPLATAFARDSNRRECLRRSILANNHRIFDRADYIRSFATFCIDASSARHSS